jgi:2-iminobutanoate/2-iminopropanoate deaminase
MKKIVSTDKAPGAIGPYSQAVWMDDTLYCSGQLGIDPATGELVSGGVVEQCVQALKNVVALLTSQGLTTANVVKTLVFLAYMGDFKVFNEIYGKVFMSEPPARSCVSVSALPLGALVEIEVIARK